MSEIYKKPMEEFRNSVGFQINFILYSGQEIENAIDNICKNAERLLKNDWRKIESERDLPENGKEVQVTIEVGGERYVTEGCYDGGWLDSFGEPFARNEKVIAWKEKCEPFTD